MVQRGVDYYANEDRFPLDVLEFLFRLRVDELRHNLAGEDSERLVILHHIFQEVCERLRVAQGRSEPDGSSSRSRSRSPRR